MMGVARTRDVLVKTSTLTGITVRFGLAAIALGMGISSSSVANAQVLDVPAHRVEFSGPTALPKCNDYDAFYGVVLNWVRVRAIDPTAKRKLVVSIKVLPDGQKREELSVWDESGTKIDEEAHNYPPTEECFKVLYWTAFDSAKLLKKTIPLPEEEPPMGVDKLVEEAEKADREVTTPHFAASNWPGKDPDAEPQRKQCEPQEAEEPRPLRHLVVGLGATVGLTRMIMPTLRVGVGRSMGSFLFELDAHLSPPLFSAEWDVEAEHKRSGSAQSYLGSFALCAQKKPLVGCVVATGGAAGYTYDKPVDDVERYARVQLGGVFLIGMRAGFEFSLSHRWALRVDADVAFPMYASEVLRPKPRFGQELVGPVWTGFVSIVPSF